MPVQENHKSIVKRILKDFSGQNNTLSIPRLYITALDGDIVAALLLSQIIYWSDRATMDDNWFAKTYDEWEQELGTSAYQVRRSVKKLKEAGVTTKRRKFRGAPTVHYHINMDQFSKWIVKKLHNPTSSSFTNEPEETSGTYTETTAKTTTKDSPAHADSADTPNTEKRQHQEPESSADNNNGVPSENAVPVDVEAWLDAVGAATDTHAKRRWLYSHQLLGTAKTGEYAEWKLEEPVTLDELRAFTAWYKRAYPGLNMPQKPATLYNMVHDFRARRAENPDIGIGGNGADRPSIHDETAFPRFPDDDCPPELRGLGLIDVRQIPQDDSERYGRACDWNSQQHPQWAHWFEQWQEPEAS